MLALPTLRYLTMPTDNTTITSPPTRWGIEQFSKFWNAPNLDLPSDELAPDVHGYWPGCQAPLIGIAEYTRPLRRLLQRVPDLRLEVAEYAESGDFTFIRWIAHGTWRDQALEFTGVDRIRQRNGQVVENRIFCSHPLIDETLAELDNGG